MVRISLLGGTGMNGICVLALLWAMASNYAMAQERPFALTNARIIPVSGPEIPDGSIVVRNGKIEAVGPTSAVRIPADAERRPAQGKVIMPGLIDSHSH